MSFPTVSTVLDNFDRGDNASLGANWSTDPKNAAMSSCRIVGNQLAGVTTNTDCANWYNVATYGPDVEVYFDLAVDESGFNEFCGIFYRLQTPGTSGVDGFEINIRLTTAAADRLRIYRIDNSVETQLGADEAPEFDVGKIGVEAIGDTHTIYKQVSGVWISVATRTDGTYNSAGYTGVYCNNTAHNIVMLDNFVAGTVVAVPTTSIRPPTTVSIVP